jgi:DNA damage-binding protein 1
MISSVWFLISFLQSEQTSSPTTLTYLSNQNLYLGSHTGDSQLLQISSSPVSTQEVPAISIPPEIRTCSSGSLSATSPRKGKGKDLLQTNDMDVDDPLGGNFSKGRVVEAMGSFITVLDSYKNIAPITDAILVDTDGTDEVIPSFFFFFFLSMTYFIQQTQIVTCSGGANTGSVNVVRNGAVFEELAFVQGITDVTNIWGVRSKYNNE